MRIGYRNYGHLNGSQPGGKGARKMLDQKADKTLMGAERRAMDTKGNLVFTMLIGAPFFIWLLKKSNAGWQH